MLDSFPLDGYVRTRHLRMRVAGRQGQGRGGGHGEKTPVSAGGLENECGCGEGKQSYKTCTQTNRRNVHSALCSVGV